MISVLIILLLIIIIQLVSMAVLFSNIVLNIKECDISYNQELKGELYIKKLKVNIELYIFKFIKILNIKIHRNYCEIFKMKIKFNTLKKLKDDDEKSWIFIVKNIRKLNPEIKKIDMNLAIGVEDPLLTTFSIPTISTFMSLLLCNSIRKYDKEKINFKITPIYVNTNNFALRGSGIFSFNALKVIYFIRKYREIKV